MVDSHTEDDENPVVKFTALAVLGAGLIALFSGYPWFWMVFAVGFAVVVPMVKVVTERSPADHLRKGGDPQRRESAADSTDSKQDALDELRGRYARGELSDEAFERKVERLLETETLESARENVGADRTNAERSDRTNAERSDRTNAERSDRTNAERSDRTNAERSDRTNAERPERERE